MAVARRSCGDPEMEAVAVLGLRRMAPPLTADAPSDPTDRQPVVVPGREQFEDVRHTDDGREGWQSATLVEP